VTPLRLALVALVACAATVLAGCGGAEPTAPAASVATTGTASPKPTLTDAIRDQIFTDAIRSEVPALANRTDAEVVKIGRSVCDYLSSGGTWVGTIKLLTDGGLDGCDAGAVTGSSVPVYCPENEYLLPSTG